MHGTGPELAELLSELKRRSGRTYEGLARRSGVTKSTLHRWCSGQGIANLFAPLERYARACGADDGELARLRRQWAVAVDAGRPATSGTVPSPSVRPAQLPGRLAAFTGRHQALVTLDALVKGAADGTAVVAITGMAGVGKTTLAIRWAHQVRDLFPDGQLYVNLRGFDPGDSTDPMDAVRGFLEALGTPADRIPAGVDAQVGLYRSLLAERRQLVLADNARDAEHVRPLLPGTPGCLVVVTSRNRLIDLVAAEGAAPVALDPMPEAEAYELLRRRLGEDRLSAEPRAVEAVVRGCAGLPLALALTAARAAGSPTVPLDAFAAELAGSADDRTGLPAAFSWSYRRCSPPAARLFRLLGLHPGPDLSTAAAASLSGVPVAQVRRHLGELVDANLVDTPGRDRYTMHDLLREYSAGLAGGEEPAEEARAATRRMLDHYRSAAARVSALLRPRPTTDPWSPGPGVIAERVETAEDALRWLAAEQAVLPAVIRIAADSGCDGHVWPLSEPLADHLFRHRSAAAMERVAGLAVDASARINDDASHANALLALGMALTMGGRYEPARAVLTRAIRLGRALGDMPVQAGCHRALGYLHLFQERSAAALASWERAARLFRSAGDRVGLARTLDSLGYGYAAVLGDHARAIRACTEAIRLHEEAGDQHSLTSSWYALADAYRCLGEPARAVELYTRVLRVNRSRGQHIQLAITLASLGDAHWEGGDRTAARTAWLEAADILERSGRPDAALLRAKVDRPELPSPRF